jgi:hypothetical protein
MSDMDIFDLRWMWEGIREGLLLEHRLIHLHEKVISLHRAFDFQAVKESGPVSQT